MSADETTTPPDGDHVGGGRHVDVTLRDSAHAPVTPMLRIHVQGDVLDAIAIHTTSDTSVEQGGVLVGAIDETTGTLLIYGSIPAEGAEATQSSLTFTHDAWDHISLTMETDWPDKRIVGWYHSHPGFGIFLSDFDQFICDNFFSEPWQAAYVHDPISGDDGFFARRDGDIIRIADWDVCTRIEAPRANNPVGEAAHRIEPVRHVTHASSAQTVNPILAGIAGLLIGALVFGLLLRSDPERVEFAVPRVATGPVALDAGSVALGRDGSIYVADDRAVRRVDQSGSTVITVFDDSRPAAPGQPSALVSVLEDGSVIYTDPSTTQLTRLAGPSRVALSVDSGPGPWTTVTAIAADGADLWVLDGPEATLWKLTVDDPSKNVASISEELALSVDGAPVIGVALAVDGGNPWILDATGRVLIPDGDAWTVAAGGGASPIGTRDVTATGFDLAGARAIVVADGVAYVSLGTSSLVPAVVVAIDDDTLNVRSNTACAGPLASTPTANGIIVVHADPCTGDLTQVPITALPAPEEPDAPVGDDETTTVPADQSSTSAPPGTDEPVSSSGDITATTAGVAEDTNTGPPNTSEP